MATQQPRKIRRSKEPCYFCVNNKEPNYKDGETLGKYLSGKSRLISRWYTGVCQTHQRRVARAVKQARYLGLMPYVQQV